MSNRGFIAIATVFAVALFAFAVAIPGVALAEEGDQADPSAESDQTAESTDEAVPLVAQDITEEPPAVAIGNGEEGLDEAAELLEENFSHFLERRPLGFDDELADLLAADFTWLYEQTSHWLADPMAIAPGVWTHLVLVLSILTLFLVLFFLIDRQSSRFANQLQAHTHFDTSLWLSTAARKSILVVGRSVAFLVLIALSFFPVRAIFGAVPWTRLLTDVLWLFLLYRVIKTVLLTSLRLHPRDLETQAQFRRLERFGMVVLRVTIFFLIALAAIDRFEYHEQLGAAVSFVFRLILALLPIYLMIARDAVLALLPPEPSSRLYRALRYALSANYHVVLALTVILLLFNAAGYTEAATFLLTRGYALLVIAAIWFAVLERLHHHVVRRARQAEDSDGRPSPLLTSLEHWIVALGSLVIIVVALRLLGLYAPLVALLQIPLLTVGHIELSTYNLLSVALIIVGTVLSVRLLRAILNAKVYPSLGVEVGAAYATNMIINYALVVVAFILSLVALGVHLSAVMVVMASLGVGIGFGLQNIAENLISGFILLFGRAVKKGDFITVNDLYGRVDAVGARSVVVHTSDNVSMLIPSKEIVSGRIINWTFHDSIVRIHIPIGVSYDSDPTEVREVLLDTARIHPDILEQPAPDVWIVGFGDSSIDFELLVYFDCRTTTERALRGKFNFLLWEALHQAEIEIPFPQRDLHVRSVTEDMKPADGTESDGDSQRRSDDHSPQD